MSTDKDDAIEGEFELIETTQVSVTQAASAAEIDMQIATARKYPRSIATFVKKACEVVQLSQESAQSCIYSLPRGNKPITGPSVRFAEVVLSMWQHGRVGASIVEIGDTSITVQGFFHDLERNVAVSAPVRRRITDKNGNRYNEDMITMTVNAASSIAIRNSILRGIPKAFWGEVYEAAKIMAVGKGKSLQEQRDLMLDAFSKIGVKPEEIYKLLEIGGYEDLGFDHLVTMRGIFTAIKEGDRGVDQVFRPETVPQPKNESPKNVAHSTLNEKIGTPRSQQQQPEGEPAQKPASKKKEAPKQEPADQKPAEEKTEQPAQNQGPSPIKKFNDLLEKCKTSKDVTALRDSFLGPKSPYQLSTDDREYITDKSASRSMDLDFQAESGQ